MSYYPNDALQDLIAQPDALVFLPHTVGTSTTITVGNKIGLSTPTTEFGTWSPTITSDVITLDSGYYYYIQSAPQFYSVGGSSPFQFYTTHQHYNETSAAYVGVQGTSFAPSTEQVQTFARDEACKFFVDCTSASIDISIKITANYLNDRVNYNSAQYVYAGLGRTIIWRLNS